MRAEGGNNIKLSSEPLLGMHQSHTHFFLITILEGREETIFFSQLRKKCRPKRPCWIKQKRRDSAFGDITVVYGNLNYRTWFGWRPGTTSWCRSRSPQGIRTLKRKWWNWKLDIISLLHHYYFKILRICPFSFKIYPSRVLCV